MKKRLFGKPHKGFTLIEIVIAAVIIGIVLAFSFVAYRQYVEKAKKMEAVVTISDIRKAEEFNKQQTGSYVSAENTQAVNQALNLAIVPKYYEYQVVGVTDDNFIVLARRIGSRIEDYLSTDRLPPDDIVLARDKSGAARRDYPRYIRNDTSESYGSGSGGSSGSSGGSGGSGSSGSSGESGSGSKESENSGGTEENGDGNTVSLPFYSTEIAAILELLEGTETGDYYYDLIIEKKISVVFEDFSAEYPSLAEGVLAFWAGTTDNTIHVNSLLDGQSCDEAISAVICHEATHADYSYNPGKWIESTLDKHPELTEGDLHITSYPLNSIDQEYNCFENSVLVWKELQGEKTDEIMDAEESIYDQGEDFMKAQIRLSYADQMLPEY
ncbi:MAG: prepilin-type N-terminal cleavage/methylation domain-containing protein [Candidatus Omnitrophica bacterium]|nr:prepilin-type N-terminal cleavage/methylation domain-containing protein [Candidatus Omnitrophota bacterium]